MDPYVVFLRGEVACKLRCKIFFINTTRHVPWFFSARLIVAAMFAQD